jgi:hypothetical protein
MTDDKDRRLQEAAERIAGDQPVTREHLKQAMGEWEVHDEELYRQITFICIEGRGEDVYDEDNATAHVRRTYAVKEYQIDVSDAEEFVKNYNECNADNPPYDTFEIKLAYWTKTREPVDLREFEHARGDE